MSKPKTVIIIENYQDPHSNTGYGNIVCKGIQDDTSEDCWKILEPKSVAKRWSSILKHNFTVINADVAKVGFYTRHSYFVIMKSLGLDKKLTNSTRAWLEKSTRDSAKNVFSWYANGLEINPDLNSSQKTLF